MQENQNQGGQSQGQDRGRQQQQNANTPSDQPGGTTRQAPMSPGDEAPAGTPGTGENICTCCGGSGKMDGGTECRECGGTGKVTVGIGGA